AQAGLRGAAGELAATRAREHAGGGAARPAHGGARALPRGRGRAADRRAPRGREARGAAVGAAHARAVVPDLRGRMSDRAWGQGVRRGIFWSTAAFAFGRAFTLIATLVLTRLLAPSQFGLVAAIV